MDFHHIVSQVITENTAHVIYCSVGCAANLKEKRLVKLEKKDQHQFPPFLQDLYHKDKSLNFVNILLDPALEDSPDCVTYIDGHSVTIGNKIKKDRMTIISCRDRCTYGEDEEGSNIMIPLINLTQYCIRTHILLFVHDFSGRGLPLKKLDRYIKAHSNIVRFDLSGGFNTGCFIDLSKGLNTPIVERKVDNKYHIFDPRCIPIHELASSISKVDSDEKKDQMLGCFGLFIKQTKNELSLIRTCYVNLKLYSNLSETVVTVTTTALIELDKLFGMDLKVTLDAFLFSKNSFYIDLMYGYLIEIFKGIVSRLFDTICTTKVPQLVEIYVNELVTEDVYNVINNIINCFDMMMIEKLGCKYLIV